MKPDQASSSVSNRTSHNQGESTVNKPCMQMLFRKAGRAVPVEGELILKLGWPHAHFFQRRCYQSRDIAVVEVIWTFPYFLKFFFIRTITKVT